MVIQTGEIKKEDFVYKLQKDLLTQEPFIGSKYWHYKGGTYKVISKGIESNEPHRIMIVYESLEHGFIWVHPLEEFEKLVEIDGKVMKRFTPYLTNCEDHWD